MNLTRIDRLGRKLDLQTVLSDLNLRGKNGDWFGQLDKLFL